MIKVYLFYEDLTASDQKADGKVQPPTEAISLRLGFWLLNPLIVSKNSGSFGSLWIKLYGYFP